MAYFQEPDQTYGWMRCAFCNKWDKTDFFISRRCEMQENTYTPRNGPNFLCQKCYWLGPPHYKYLNGLFKRLNIPKHVVNNIARLAYRPCGIRICKYDIFDSDYEYECDFCDESWIEWKCYYCGNNANEINIQSFGRSYEGFRGPHWRLDRASDNHTGDSEAASSD